MSAVEGPDPHREIIIVRRGGHDDEHEHHGGVWKIAFADFMTAMMCFFLVMWLINAANEETRAALASYFNPIKLVDRNSSRKGIEDVGEGPSAPEGTSDTKVDDLSEVASGAGPKLTGPSLRNEGSESVAEHTDEHLFANPYAVLAEIAEQTGTMQNISAKGDGGAQDAGPATGASGGESFRDPFAPDFWSQQVIPDHETPPADATAADEMPEIALERSAVAAPAPQDETEADAATPTPVAASETAEEAAEAEEPKAQGQAVAPAADAVADAEPEPPAPEAPPQVDPEALRVAKAIREAIAREFGASEKILEGMLVEATTEGVLIAVTDQLDFGMFEIGSAVPRRDLVLAMEKISRIVSAQSGNIKINGHTDGRPFSSDTYDNWRLSTARAHSAYYMLVRGGLDEKRIVEVAGFADRKLKIADDPYADANRRIEILLEAGE